MVTSSPLALRSLIRPRRNQRRGHWTTGHEPLSTLSGITEDDAGLLHLLRFNWFIKLRKGSTAAVQRSQTSLTTTFEIKSRQVLLHLWDFHVILVIVEKALTRFWMGFYCQTNLNVFILVITCKMTPPLCKYASFETAADPGRVCAHVRT